MNLKQYDTVYFLGIGGIGMSALARWFKYLGMTIAGYDSTSSKLTNELIAEGMDIHFGCDLEKISNYLTMNTLVIYTPAVPVDNAEYNFFLENKIPMHKRSEILGLISKNFITVAIAGTHGKTTTSSMIAHILKSADMSLVAFLGGIANNYNSNLIFQGNMDSKTFLVAEADEFDRSFLRLFPKIAVVTSADADHLDIYGNHQNLLTSFKDFVGQIDKSGFLVIHKSVEKLTSASRGFVCKSYSLDEGDFYVGNLVLGHRSLKFDVLGFQKTINIELNVAGIHNVENALAALIVCNQLGVKVDVIQSALSSYTGVKRRFEYIIERDDLVYIDDYAHHPAEILSFLKSLKTIYPSQKITVVFQPHLYSRTRDFASEFAQSLSLADEILLLEIYPARELPMEGVSSEIIFNGITCKTKILCHKNDLLNQLNKLEIKVLATLGAGDIDSLVSPIKENLMQRNEI